MDEKSPRPDVDAVRLDLEIRQHEDRIYFERWKADVVSIDQMLIANTQGMISIGQFDLRMGALLNGGAMVALPALIKATAIGTKVDIHMVVAALAAFVVGLVFTGGASIVAFEATRISDRRLTLTREIRAINLNVERHPQEAQADLNKARETALSNESQELVRLNSKLRYFTALMAGALVTFAIGSGFAAYAFLAAK